MQQSFCDLKIRLETDEMAWNYQLTKFISSGIWIFASHNSHSIQSLNRETILMNLVISSILLWSINSYFVET
jgi:hypothetical protein